MTTEEQNKRAGEMIREIIRQNEEREITYSLKTFGIHGKRRIKLTGHLG